MTSISQNLLDFSSQYSNLRFMTFPVFLRVRDRLFEFVAPVIEQCKKSRLLDYPEPHAEGAVLSH